MPKYISVQFMTAEEKEKVVKAMKSFLKSDFSKTTFTDRLYKHLTLHCGFIAHFNIHGYFDTYFTSPEGKVRWANMLCNERFCHEDYRDINAVLIDMVDAKMKETIADLNKQAMERDLAQATALLQRHGFQRQVAHPDKMVFEMVPR